MTLIVYELITTVYQEILVGSHDIQLAACRPHLLRFGNPAGSLQMKILDVNGNYIASSDSVAISAIGSYDSSGSLVASNYWHGYIRFLLTTQLKKATKYRLQLLSSGYTFSESAYIGWCNDFDLRKVQPTFSPSSGTAAPLDLELWENVDSWRRTG